MTEPRPGTTVVIRDATREDIPAIAAIERASFGDPWSELSFHQLLAGGASRVRVAELDGAPRAFSVAWVVGDEAELANIAVHPEARRRGLGAALLDDLLAVTDRGRGATVFLEVRAGNATAQALYRSRGFVAAGVRKAYYRQPTEDAMVMRRDPRIGAAAGASVRPTI